MLPRNFRLTGTETRQTFSRMFAMAKKFKKLFASIRCVSSIIVVLNAKLTQLSAAHANKKYSENEQAQRECRFFASYLSITYFPTIYAS